MKNNEIAKLYFEEIWNKKNFELAYDLISKELTTRFPSTHGYGPEGLINVIKARYSIFPDLRFEIIDSVSEDNKIWVRYNFTGTHKGTFWNIKPTNQKVNFDGIILFNINLGKIIKASSIRDELTLLEQIRYLNINKDDNQ
ncbi:ester cyclase [Candidatus Dojkabacteria bacterium]|uniref:Ester cyclase n=1 Tax=Candidatus Dojkabacteria bacterium TaxID=2099670 RepID=A0A955L1K7_9BACT|nr:ester cyclase [Candidatus Dojkabacteria bacterium]